MIGESDKKREKIVAELADKLNSVETMGLTTSNHVRQLADKQVHFGGQGTEVRCRISEVRIHGTRNLFAK